MAALAVEYSRACQRVSDKAEQCRDLLRKGLRTQAVGLARKAPDLRDEFKEVDFPGQVAWLDICESRGLDVPPLLETDAIAATIDEVYMESENLEQLVKSHRRMAIGRAPLADRLRNLRAICRHDPDNENWKQDIHKYELARQEELAATAEQAGTGGPCGHEGPAGGGQVGPVAAPADPEIHRGPGAVDRAARPQGGGDRVPAAGRRAFAGP